MAPSPLLRALVDDAAMFPPGNAEADEAVAAHRRYRAAWFAAIIGPLVVADSALGSVARAIQAEVTADEPDGSLAVSMVNTTGAGGLLSLANRRTSGLTIVAVESALRDLDDLAQNAARVVAAAEGLDDDIRVFVEIPYAPGWERAVAEVEAAGHFGKIRVGGPDPADTPSAQQLGRQLSVLIEADLPFKATAGLHHAVAVDQSADPATGGPGQRRHGFLNLLAAVDALIEGAAPSDATEILTRTDGAGLASEIAAWDAARMTRVRRRLVSFGCCGVLDPVQDLVGLGLLSRPQ
jgi:hypothetical protein